MEVLKKKNFLETQNDLSITFAAFSPKVKKILWKPSTLPCPLRLLHGPAIPKRLGWLWQTVIDSKI